MRAKGIGLGDADGNTTLCLPCQLLPVGLGVIPLSSPLWEAPVLSAGFEPGERISPWAVAMLAHWGIDAREHRPRPLRRALCDEASAIFVMAPTYMHRLFLEYGQDLATRAYLFADPFSQPQSFTRGEYRVYDPSFDDRPTDG